MDRRQVVLALGAALAAGCRTLPPPALEIGVALDWPAREKLLQQLRRFECAGRVAVAAADQGFNAQFTWQQQDERSRLSVRGPFGSGGFQLEAQGDSLRLQLANGAQFDGDRARAELERTIGAPLPVAALGFWLLGTPQPEYPASSALAAAGVGQPPQLARLEQRSWVIAYQPHGGLPRQLSLQGGAARVRLVVERWGAPP
jgi:outer membrane lipoprotein LolB